MSSNLSNQSKSMVINSIFLLVSRLFIALLFLPAGINKIGDFNGTVGYITSMGLPFPTLSAILAIIIEVGCGILLLAGYQQKLASIVLAIFTLVASVVFHAFWSVPAENAFIQELLFYKNIAIVGGLFALYVSSSQAHTWSIDGLRNNKH